jgi:MoxR-like ATPase
MVVSLFEKMIVSLNQESIFMQTPKHNRSPDGRKETHIELHAKAFSAVTRLIQTIASVMQGQTHSIRLLVAAFLSGGHVLLEDVPGTGKTTLAKALAASPDLLPSDILGVSIYNPKSQTFELHKGPIFTHILLADEINRASPRTQSALLEAMAEGQVTLEREKHLLHEPFFVIATQNPVESHGTYPLPEAQMDRFSMRFSLGYVSTQQEVEILSQQTAEHPVTSLQPCIHPDDWTLARSVVQSITLEDSLKHYIVELVAATRTWNGITLGASPRASLALMKAAQALALIEGMHFVTPDHIQALAVPVIAHRLRLETTELFSGNSPAKIVSSVVDSIRVPV